MPTRKQAYELLKSQLEHGRDPDEKVHVLFVEQEAKERVENPHQRTRFVMETDSPVMYSRFNAAKDHWLRLANKSVALDVMCRLWEQATDEDIERFCAGND